MNQGHILLPANAESEYVTQVLSLKFPIFGGRLTFRKNKNSGILSYDVPKTGIYYVLAISYGRFPVSTIDATTVPGSFVFRASTRR